MPNAFQDFAKKFGTSIAAGTSILGTGLNIGATINTSRANVGALRISASLARRQNEVAEIGFTQTLRDLRVKHEFLRGTILDAAGRSGIRGSSGTITAQLANLAGEVRLTELRERFNVENEAILRDFAAEYQDYQAETLKAQRPFQIAGDLLGGVSNLLGVFK